MAGTGYRTISAYRREVAEWNAARHPDRKVMCETENLIVEESNIGVFFGNRQSVHKLAYYWGMWDETTTSQTTGPK